MKNITLAIDENVLTDVRRYAAANNTTVNSLVRDYLTRLASQDDRLARARRELLKLSEESTWDPGADWTWDREALYDRGLHAGHERTAVLGVQEPRTLFKEETRE